MDWLGSSVALTSSTLYSLSFSFLSQVALYAVQLLVVRSAPSPEASVGPMAEAPSVL